MIKKFITWLGEPMIFETKLGFYIWLLCVLVLSELLENIIN